MAQQHPRSELSAPPEQSRQQQQQQQQQRSDGRLSRLLDSVQERLDTSISLTRVLSVWGPALGVGILIFKSRSFSRFQSVKDIPASFFEKKRVVRARITGFDPERRCLLFRHAPALRVLWFSRQREGAEMPLRLVGITLPTPQEKEVDGDVGWRAARKVYLRLHALQDDGAVVASAVSRTFPLYRNVALDLVARGLARVDLASWTLNPRVARRYERAERRARRQRLGLWALQPPPPPSAAARVVSAAKRVPAAAATAASEVIKVWHALGGVSGAEQGASAPSSPASASASASAATSAATSAASASPDAAASQLRRRLFRSGLNLSSALSALRRRRKEARAPLSSAPASSPAALARAP